MGGIRNSAMSQEIKQGDADVDLVGNVRSVTIKNPKNNNKKRQIYSQQGARLFSTMYFIERKGIKYRNKNSFRN